MELLKTTREKLGLSQTEMAKLFGLDKGRIAMAETGKRKLPPQARNILVWMADLLQETTAPLQNPAPKPEPVEKQIKKLKAKLDVLQVDLENKETKTEKALLFISVCPKMESAFTGKTSVPTHKWINALLNEKELQLEKDH